jgi:hypothetical protein
LPERIQKKCRTANPATAYCARSRQRRDQSVKAGLDHQPLRAKDDDGYTRRDMF